MPNRPMEIRDLLRQQIASALHRSRLAPGEAALDLWKHGEREIVIKAAVTRQ